VTTRPSLDRDKAEFKGAMESVEKKKQQVVDFVRGKSAKIGNAILEAL
jgi:hypothetical protein